MSLIAPPPVSDQSPARKPTFYEFFAGGGMVRAGLGAGWTCLFANDFCPKKAAIYRDNWGDQEMLCGDIRALSIAHMPGAPDLAWGSFPCQDLSLAGAGAGLTGGRSGTFWSFIDHMAALKQDGRAPRVIALENVIGTLTSRGGADFTAICAALHDLGYAFGALVIDAALFVPQSRPRLFIIAVRRNRDAATAATTAAQPHPIWHSAAVRRAYGALPDDLKSAWRWWSAPPPPPRSAQLIDLIEDPPGGVAWNAPEKTAALLDMMTEVHRAKAAAQRVKARRVVGTLYRRTRDGVQRAEARFDGLAGCLRTPAGGSSRQTLLFIDGDQTWSRLVSPRETARLMGLPDRYRLPRSSSEAYHLTGDGVVVPVVRQLAAHILEPLIQAV